MEGGTSAGPGRKGRIYFSGFFLARKVKKMGADFVQLIQPRACVDRSAKAEYNYILRIMVSGQGWTWETWIQ
jgi:hypothetical protein